MDPVPRPCALSPVQVIADGQGRSSSRLGDAPRGRILLLEPRAPDSRLPPCPACCRERCPGPIGARPREGGLWWPSGKGLAPQCRGGGLSSRPEGPSCCPAACAPTSRAGLLPAPRPPHARFLVCCWLWPFSRGEATSPCGLDRRVPAQSEEDPVMCRWPQPPLSSLDDVCPCPCLSSHGLLGSGHWVPWDLMYLGC